VSAPLAGPQLAEAIRTFWDESGAGRIMEHWNADAASAVSTRNPESAAGAHFSSGASSVHATVWEQMQTWLDNLALAFPSEAMPLAEWLPVLEAGLSGLTIGVIPPALDQVLVGSIDRSRNPDLKRAYILGLNETVFPSPPSPPLLLTEPDRERLELEGCALGNGPRVHLGHERFYGYIACTRARESVTLTHALRDTHGRALNPSSFLKHLQRLFPALTPETASPVAPWHESEHACELIGPLLTHQARPAGERDAALEALAGLPGLAAVLDRLKHLQPANLRVSLPAEAAARLYGTALTTSVSRIEQFAACPFRFFVHSGLRVEERKRYELDIRQQGSFQHEVLAAYHHEIRNEGKQWRDLVPDEARARVGAIADRLMESFEGGLFHISGRNRFLARSYKAALQRFIGVITEWMDQYEFDPFLVESGFGLKDGLFPAWELDLGGDRTLLLAGRIDRIDVWRDLDTQSAWCVVIDYKSGQRKLDPVLLDHGVQQQLPAYLNVLRHLKNPEAGLEAPRIIPAGVFFVPLRGYYESASNRREVLADALNADKRAYQHRGLFSTEALPMLDIRPDAASGDQFQYRLTKDRKPWKNSVAAMEPGDFSALLQHQETLLRTFGRRIYEGDVAIDPWKKKADNACATCGYQSICRIDPWTHDFRVLRPRETDV
jgi:ATP-dependent helicase/nuclease subunit B